MNYERSKAAATLPAPFVDMASSFVSRTPNGGPLGWPLRTEHPVSTGRPTLPEGSATWWWPMPGSLLGVDVTRATLPAALQTGNAGGSPAPSAAPPPLAVANAVGRAVHDPLSPQGPKGAIPIGVNLRIDVRVVVR